MENCMFDPPVSTPISLIMRMDASRSTWYSLSVSVCAGATVMESPVCTPMGSKFSMEQMMTTLSFLSLITSSSNSFQPITDSSMSISLTGLQSRPNLTMSSYSSLLYAMPPPMPPSVKDGLMMTGKFMVSIISKHSWKFFALPLLGTSKPILCMASLKSSLSSAIFMAGSLAPIISTPYFSRTPLSASLTETFSAVCPPIVGRSASGLSFSIIFSTISGVIGSMYVLSASVGSVMMVAGFELTSTTSYPSSFRALHA